MVVSTRLHYDVVMEELQPTSIRLQPELKAALKRLAQEDRRSLSSYIVLVLERHVTEREKAARRRNTTK
jgi:predicted DNA-binding protein